MTTVHPSMRDISNVLSRHTAGHDDRRLGEFLAVSVGRVLLKIANRGDDWHTQVNEEKLRHITDWLRAALVNNEPWLGQVDGQDRPKKLMKFNSIDQIVSQANKAMLKAAQRLSTVNLVEGDEELIAELEDGSYIVRLLTPAALDRETAEMQHCIGNGGYDQNLGRWNFRYLSLRDRFGKAHATLEIENDRIIQLQGKQNRPPIQTYIDQLIPFIRAEGYSVAVPASHLGYVVDADGNWHDIHSLPNGLKIDGNLVIIHTDVSTLPEELTVGGNLSLYGTNITVLPKGLTVDGTLDLQDLNIRTLPVDISVGGDLILKGTNIDALPDGLKVGGWLNLRNTRVSTLPEDLEVGGRLILDDSNVSVLPKGLKVGGDLHLSWTMVTALPNGLEVGGNLFLNGSHIRSLPEWLKVNGNLQMAGLNIEVLPASLRVGGSLDLSNTKIMVFPDELRVVRGDLFLGGTDIAVLPRRLEVWGNLDLRHTPIECLPEELRVGGNLNLNGSDIISLPERMMVAGDIHLCNTGITILPDCISDETRVICDLGSMTAKDFRQMHNSCLPTAEATRPTI